MSDPTSHRPVEEVAIIGMAGRFPGARSVEAFWRNVRDGVESVSFFSEDELAASGVAATTLRDPNYVRAGVVLDDVDMFDADFFSFTPREAEITDPQHRMLLECAWEAMEDAGYIGERFGERVGVFVGAGLTRYLLNVLSRHAGAGAADIFQFLIGNEKDHLPAKISYKLNLSGPSINVQTACSTSLVAVALACQSLLSYQCDAALAGGVTIVLPQRTGYHYQEGGVTSPDGHTCTFDQRARGTVPGSGAGLVYLKRYSEALADGDNVHAVIRGTAINNDGASRIGYTAPGVDGQAAVIAEALAASVIEASSIGCIEAHGTGTPLGDPIEVAALTKAFRHAGDKRRAACAIGSVKTNVGHLDAAAGIAGLIKIVEAIKHKQLPPSLNFERANPEIDFAASPFYVNAELREWPAGETPRRAAVSSFGIGGTNVHLIVEEAQPRVGIEETNTTSQLLVLSARSAPALEKSASNIAAHLERQNPDVRLDDLAYTLQLGRKSFAHRLAMVCEDTAGAIAALKTKEPGRVFIKKHEGGPPRIAMMFPGQGTQHLQMAAGLYTGIATFRREVDTCAEMLKPQVGFDLREILYPEATRSAEAEERLLQTSVTQPALFTIEYALAKLWESWGVHPAAMIGHSIGEYVAACLAGVFSLPDALRLVAERGRLMEQLPEGAMLAVALTEPQALEYLDDGLSLAAVNGPDQCVLSGEPEAVNEVASKLAAEGIVCIRLQSTRAFHSASVDGVLARFSDFVGHISMQAPKTAYVSTVTGTWVTAAQATSRDFWTRQLREPVRFAGGINELLRGETKVLLEVGPGNTLSSLVRRHPDKSLDHVIVPSLSRAREQKTDSVSMLEALAQLWLAGLEPDWKQVHGAQRSRVSLPTYPFERRRYWIDLPAPALSSRVQDAGPPVEQEFARTSAAGTNKVPIDAALEVSDGPSLTETERKIAAIWQEVFGLSHINVDADFFSLGGNSLVGLQLISRVRKAFDTDLTMRSFFEAPTIASLARLVDESLPSEEEIAGLEELLSEIESMSPEDLQTSLEPEVLQNRRALHKGSRSNGVS